MSKSMSVSLPRLICVVVIGASTLWFVIGVTVANIARSPAPQTALAWAPFDAGAMAQMAAGKLQPNRSPPPEARTLARAALARDPTQVLAARTLGLVEAMGKQPEKAGPLLRYSERLSRRDLPTQFWFIENSVNRDEIDQALHHYDIALRTSETSGNILLPILVKASEDPAIRLPLKRMLDQRPWWWGRLVTKAIYESVTPATAAFLSHGLIDATSTENRTLVTALLGRLVEAGEYNVAWATYERLTPEGKPQFLRNGGFENENRLPPLDWSLTSDSELAAQSRLRPDGRGYALYLIGAGGRGGVVARQIVRLSPGTYRLSATVGDVNGDDLSRPIISIDCAGRVPRSALSFALPLAPPQGMQVAANFNISPECPNAWVSIVLRGRLDGVTTSPWIDSLVITQRGSANR